MRMRILKGKMKLVGHVTLQRPGMMTVQGRRAVAKWLRQTAKDLAALGDQYTHKTFHARYWTRAS